MRKIIIIDPNNEIFDYTLESYDLHDEVMQNYIQYKGEYCSNRELTVRGYPTIFIVENAVEVYINRYLNGDKMEIIKDVIDKNHIRDMKIEVGIVNDALRFDNIMGSIKTTDEMIEVIKNEYSKINNATRSR